MARSKTKIVLITIDGVEMEAKQCTACSDIKPLTEYFKQKGGLGGRRGYCKKCFYAKHGEKANQRSKEWQEKNKEKVKIYNREWTKENRGRINERERIRYNENPDFFRERNRKKYERNPDVSIQAQYKYRKKHREKHLIYQRSYYKENKEIFSESNKRYVKENKEVIDAIRLRRRARKKNLPDELTADEMKWIMEKFDYCCALSGQRLEALDLDHFIPLSIGRGGTIVGNIIPLSPSLNGSKQDSNPFEWIKREDIQRVVPIEKFNEVVRHLSELNNMTVDQYKEYVYFCFENPICYNISTNSNKKRAENSG